MPFVLDPHINLQNHIRASAPELRYVEILRERGALLTLDNVWVDCEQLLMRAFQCDSTYCLRAKGKGADRTYTGCCCTDLQVEVTPDEVEKLRELGRTAAERLDPAPTSQLGKLVQRLNEGEITERTDKGELIFKHLGSSRCPLSVFDKHGQLLCGINTLCAQLERPLPIYKPEPCFIFPLHYAEPLPGKYLVTLVTLETYRYIGADKYTSQLRCLKKPQPGAPRAWRALKHELILCFGEAFYEQLVPAATDWLREHDTPEEED